MVTTWKAIEEKYEPVADEHWKVCELFGLKCPFDVFEQLFHDHQRDVDFAIPLVGIDWGRVSWREVSLSGVKLRQVATPRGYQYAVDEARTRTREEGIQDERAEVVASWRDEGTWMRSPLLVEGDVIGSVLEYELLVGFTRLGNLLGLLDRGEIAEYATHRVWTGGIDRAPGRPY